MNGKIDNVLASSKLMLFAKGDFTLILDASSSSNLASQDIVEKLNLKIETHPNPYQISWVDDNPISMSSHCLVTFNFCNNFELSVWCDILPMKVAYIMLGRSSLFYKRVQHDGEYLYAYA